jgi:hypothetical protein
MKIELDLGKNLASKKKLFEKSLALELLQNQNIFLNCTLEVLLNQIYN